MLDHLVIIEIKQEKQSSHSNIYHLLKEKSIRPCSVSKYCLGTDHDEQPAQIKYF